MPNGLCRGLRAAADVLHYLTSKSSGRPGMEGELPHGRNSANAPQPKLRFGPFELDVCAGELRKEGRRIRLQQQPFEILRMLLESPHEVVTRENIRNRLWPEGTVVEFDHSINAAVKRLRDALRDSAEKPRYVETLARRGYRFIGELDVDDWSRPAKPVIVMTGPQEEPVPGSERHDVKPSGQPPIPMHFVLPRAALIALLAITGTSIWLVSRTSLERQPLVPVPLTS